MAVIQLYTQCTEKAEEDNEIEELGECIIDHHVGIEGANKPRTIIPFRRSLKWQARRRGGWFVSKSRYDVRGGKQSAT